ncbi:hypothetical protein D3C79_1062790 [compost metagenome]
MLHRDLRKGYEQAGRYQRVDEAVAFHNDVLAPFVAQYVGPKLLTLHVDDCVHVLTRYVFELVRQRAWRPAEQHGLVATS